MNEFEDASENIYSSDNKVIEKIDNISKEADELRKKLLNTEEVKESEPSDVSLVDEETIHEVNRDYRKVDRVTDVISFAFNDDKESMPQSPHNKRPFCPMPKSSCQKNYK